jgi:hypothetical protein
VGAGRLGGGRQEDAFSLGLTTIPPNVHL